MGAYLSNKEVTGVLLGHNKQAGSADVITRKGVCCSTRMSPTEKTDANDSRSDRTAVTRFCFWRLKGTRLGTCHLHNACMLSDRQTDRHRGWTSGRTDRQPARQAGRVGERHKVGTCQTWHVAICYYHCFSSCNCGGGDSLPVEQYTCGLRVKLDAVYARQP